MPTILLKAKFRGEQKEKSFKKGLNYNLEFEIQNVQEDNKPGDQMPVQIRTTTKPSLTSAYKTIYEFFDNWTDIKPR